jgi:hypothetical protein
MEKSICRTELPLEARSAVTMASKVLHGNLARSSGSRHLKSRDGPPVRQWRGHKSDCVQERAMSRPLERCWISAHIGRTTCLDFHSRAIETHTFDGHR